MYLGIDLGTPEVRLPLFFCSPMTAQSMPSLPVLPRLARFRDLYQRLRGA